MAKNKISEWSSLASNNTDVGGIDIAEGCAPSGINNAIREVMAQVKDMVTGADGDSQTIGGNLNVTGTSTLTGAVTAPAGITGNLIGAVTGNVTGNAGTVTNGVYTIGNQTIAGTKTFSSSILGNLTGNVTGNLTGDLVATAPTAPTASFGVNTTQIATTAFVQTALAALHPIGSIYIAVISTNPASLFGFGTWVAYGTGRTLVAIDTSNALMDVVGETFGVADAIIPSHSHTATSTVTDPSHSHTLIAESRPGGSGGSGGLAGPTTITTTSAVTGITVATSITTTGISVTNQNYQPSIAVYIWNRTA